MIIKINRVALSFCNRPVYQIEYHFVWVTKYLYKVLSEEVVERVCKLVKRMCGAFEIRIVKGVVSSPPSLVPSKIMRRIKGHTASKLFEEFPHLKKRYWGQHCWERGYFCVTVGQMTEEIIEQYLEHLFEPSLNDNFKMEQG